MPDITSKEIAIRHVVRFGYGKSRVDLPLPGPLPKNTLDPRYVACPQHRTACDCREALFAEDRAEFRYELERIRKAFDTVLEGHATWASGVDKATAERLQCKCTGCHIARRVHLGYANEVVVESAPPRYAPLPVFTPGEEVPF